MGWSVSRFRAGDFVVVRSKEEILATLDEKGQVDGMPFMPEMLQYCGQRVQVSGVAHKTCETANKTWQGRRLAASVHLSGLRCDGSAHGGCQAECNLFWKDAWLKPADTSATSAGIANQSTVACDESRLLALALQPSKSPDDATCYSCQATCLLGATEPLAWWDLRQYVKDVRTRNHRAGHVLRVLTLAALRWVLPRVPYGYRVAKGIHDRLHLAWTGRGAPTLDGKIPPGTTTPTGELGLKTGEYVRVKAQAEIEKTLDQRGHNRGLSFDPAEMAGYCGRVFKVRKSVTMILDEGTGKMVRMKYPCIMLEGVVCKGEYSTCRLNCPRAIPTYWRELWLERVEVPTLSKDTPTLETAPLQQRTQPLICESSSEKSPCA